MNPLGRPAPKATLPTGRERSSPASTRATGSPPCEVVLYHGGVELRFPTFDYYGTWGGGQVRVAINTLFRETQSSHMLSGSPHAQPLLCQSVVSISSDARI